MQEMDREFCGTQSGGFERAQEFRTTQMALSQLQERARRDSGQRHRCRKLGAGIAFKLLFRFAGSGEEIDAFEQGMQENHRETDEGGGRGSVCGYENAEKGCKQDLAGDLRILLLLACDTFSTLRCHHFDRCPPPAIFGFGAFCCKLTEIQPSQERFESVDRVAVPSSGPTHHQKKKDRRRGGQFDTHMDAQRCHLRERCTAFERSRAAIKLDAILVRGGAFGRVPCAWAYRAWDAYGGARAAGKRKFLSPRDILDSSSAKCE
jgi:hypothetical protein